MGKNFQVNTWSSDFGKEYTDRHIYAPDELDNFYNSKWGISRTDMNNRFLQGLNLYNGKILEVGCNVGNQLGLLKQMGYNDLYGIELQGYAVEKAKSLTQNINIIQASGDDIPFKDGCFDLVFTSGVLIHIAPENVGAVQDEIYRCSRRYIWGFEYYADTYTQVNYRGNDGLLWKTDFAKLYLDRFPDLEMVKEEKFKYIADDNVDCMYLLRKRK